MCVGRAEPVPKQLVLLMIIVQQQTGYFQECTRSGSRHGARREISSSSVHRAFLAVTRALVHTNALFAYFLRCCSEFYLGYALQLQRLESGPRPAGQELEVL